MVLPSFIPLVLIISRAFIKGTKAFANHSAYTYLLCDASKIGKESYLKFADLSLVNAVITDADMSKLAGFKEQGLDILNVK
jgi:DeoR family fructose operon transcriptional repressor